MARPHRTNAECYIGFRRYYLTICTYRREPSFADSETVARTLLQFLQRAGVEGFEIVVYCFMPDHVHLIVAGASADADLQRFVRLGKQRSGFDFTRATGRRLWQESFFDRVVRSDENLHDWIAYVVDNPRRAGIVRTPADYPYWGSLVYAREEILDFVMAARRV